MSLALGMVSLESAKPRWLLSSRRSSMSRETPPWSCSLESP